jgi:hypothetical protein
MLNYSFFYYILRVSAPSRWMTVLFLTINTRQDTVTNFCINRQAAEHNLNGFLMERIWFPYFESHSLLPTINPLKNEFNLNYKDLFPTSQTINSKDQSVF